MKIRDLDDAALLEEWHKWDAMINEAKSWGASLAAADEFRKECTREMERRKQLGTMDSRDDSD